MPPRRWQVQEKEGRLCEPIWGCTHNRVRFQESVGEDETSAWLQMSPQGSLPAQGVTTAPKQSSAQEEVPASRPLSPTQACTHCWQTMCSELLWPRQHPPSEPLSSVVGTPLCLFQAKAGSRLCSLLGWAGLGAGFRSPA